MGLGGILSLDYLRRVRETLAVAGVLALAAAAWAIWLGEPAFPMDDAYIVQHSAAGVLLGEETRFLDSSPLAGATSRWHVILLAGFGLLLPIASAQVFLAAVAAFAYLIGVWTLARGEQTSVLQAMGVTFLAALAGATPYHMFNGLETGMAMAALVWTFVGFTRPRPAHRAWWLLIGALPFIRPELMLWSALLLLRAMYNDGRTEQLGARIRYALEAVLLATLAIAPVILVLALTGEDVLAATASGKEAFFAEGCRPLSERLGMFAGALSEASGMVGVILAAPFLVTASRMRWVSLAFIISFLVIYALKFPGGLTHNAYRYLHLLAPFLILGLVSPLRHSEPRSRTIGASALAVCLVISLFGAPKVWRIYEASLDNARHRNTATAEWVANHLPADAVVMVHDAGVISLHGQQKLVDLVGLKTAGSLAIQKETTFRTCSRDPRAMAAIAARYNATHLLTSNDWNARFELTKGLEAAGWRVRRIDGDRGETSTSVFELSPPSGSIAAAVTDLPK